MGPRFLTTMLPFLGFPIALAVRRFPGPTIALAGVSVTATAIATVTHPLIGYENEAVVWMHLLGEGSFQPTIASSFGLGRSWGGIWPFALAVGAALVFVVRSLPRTHFSGAALAWGFTALVAWALFAALGPTVLGIDHQGLLSIIRAGDPTALNLKLHSGSRYQLRTLAPLAALVGLLGLAAVALTRDAPRAPGRRRADAAPALSG